ncbi:MAG: methylmalonyl-CoA mutase family protein [Acidimicrobiales bacterium]
MEEHPSPVDEPSGPTHDEWDEWMAAVDGVLAGRGFDDVLVHHTRDGLAIAPLYTARTHPAAVDLPGAGTHTRGPVDPARIEHGWDVRARHRVETVGDAAACREAIVEDLERGVTSIELAGGESFPVSADELEPFLAGVHLDRAPIWLAPHASLDRAETLVEIWRRRGVDPADCHGGLGLDPFGEWARGGELTDESVMAAAELVADLGPPRPGVRSMSIDTTGYAEAGATEGEELAWGTATGVACLRALAAAGLDPRAAAAELSFRWSADSDQFATMAKLRAARRLWARVLEVCGVPEADRGQHQTAVTSQAMYTRLAAPVNALRATTAVLAAASGGADAVVVLPFDHAIGDPDRVSRRLARNTQLLLIEESHLARVTDPAGGAWFVESFTTDLAGVAWRLFQEVERTGGITAAVIEGRIASAVDAGWSDLQSRLRRRVLAVTGVSEFPLAGEAVPSTTAAGAGAGLPLRRRAAAFEALRQASDRHLAATGERPAVHLAVLGPLAEHIERSAWASNLLAVGGVVAVGSETDGADSPLEAAADFADHRRRSGCEAAVTKQSRPTTLRLAVCRHRRRPNHPRRSTYCD